MVLMPAADGPWRRQEMSPQASYAQSHKPKFHFLITGHARGGNDFVRPSPLIELGIKKDWLAIEMGNEYVIDLAAIDHLQDCNHRFGRFKSAHVDMESIGGVPHPTCPR